MRELLEREKERIAFRNERESCFYVAAAQTGEILFSKREYSVEIAVCSTVTTEKCVICYRVSMLLYIARVLYHCTAFPCQLCALLNTSVPETLSDSFSFFAVCALVLRSLLQVQVQS